MAGVAAVSVSWPRGDPDHGAPRNRSKQDDIALALCQRWLRLHEEILALCREQQLLEAHWVERFDSSGTQVSHRSDGEIADQPIERSHALYSEDRVERSGVLFNLTTRKAASVEVAISRTDELIRQSEAAEQSLLNELWRTRASTIEGVLAKLLVILRNGEHWDDSKSFPWPHINSVLNDIARQHGIDPAVFAALL